MKWEDAINLFEIQRIYKNISIEKRDLLDENIIELGKRWLKSQQKKSLLLSGRGGCGKTYFSICLLRGLIEKNEPWIIFRNGQDINRELLASMFQGNQRDVIDKYSQVPYLFWDDFGIENGSDRLIDQYCSIFDKRVGNELLTICTSNLTLESLEKVFGERIGSRLKTFFCIQFPNVDFRGR